MISPQDFDRLSAYLDHQLSPAETAALEARLARDPKLKAALADLRWTVRALQTLPRVKPPRNFTLSPKQVRSLEAPRPVFSVFRFASALAAIALVVVLAGDLSSGWLVASRAAAPAQAVQPETAAESSAAPTEAAVVAFAPAPTTPEAPVTTATNGQSDKSAATDENTATADSAQQAGVSDETPAPASAASGGGALPPTAAPMETGLPTDAVAAGASRSSPTATAAPPDEVLPPALPTEAPMATAQAVLSTEAITPAALPETPLAVAQATTPVPVAEGPSVPSVPAQPDAGWLTPMRGIEIGLAIVSVLLAGLAWLARKR